LLSRSGFRHGFSLRTGGVSAAPFDSLNLARKVGDAPDAVAENHRRFAAEVGYAIDALYEVSQVHGADVARVDEQVSAEAFRVREADAIVCGIPEHAAAVRVADCVPVLVGDPETGVVAAIHAGWRGVVAQVVRAGVRALCAELTVPPTRLVAALGPHIGVEAFEVSQDVAVQLVEAVGDAEIAIAGFSRPHVDLARAVHLQLRQAGLVEDRIERVAGCTFADPTRFYSFRRDGAASGRHLAVIVAGC
jgi:hypothetical protein